MDIFQWLCFAGLGLAFAGRDLTLKHYNGQFKPLEFASLIGPLQFLTCLLIFPFVLKFGPDITDLGKWTHPLVVGPAIAKGFMIWIGMQLYLKIVKESLGAAVYIGPIGTGAVAVLNFLIYGEALTTMQWTSVTFIAILAILFFIFGPLGKLTRGALIAFAINVIFLTTYGLFDFGVLSNSNWYIYLVYASMGMMFGNLVFARTAFLRIPKTILPKLACAWLIPEFLVHIVLVNILPVSLTFLAMTMRITISMPLSAILWNEGSPKRLMLFAIAAVAAVIPLLFD